MLEFTKGDIAEKTIEGFKEIKPKEQVSLEELDQKWDKKFEKIKQEKNNESGIPERFYSTEEKRAERWPTEGEWKGTPGESKFIPNDNELKKELSNYKIDGIEYRKGVPDFSPVSKLTVKIDHMTHDKDENYKSFGNKCLKEGIFTSSNELRRFKKDNNLIFHECSDMKTCQLVPRLIHEKFTHTGGRYECRLRDNGGSKYDE